MSVNQNISLKSLKLSALFLLSPLFIFAQTLTGLWTGVLSNDSNSVRKDQSFEIALTEYRGKVFGYSRAEFIVHDTLYYIVKRVKGIINGDTCEVKDDEILSYNFPTRPDKKVKVSSFFYRNKNDSSWRLSGKWKTNKTKEYYSVTGKLDLKEEKDLSASKLFPHLQELNLLDDVAFYKDWKKEKNPVVMKQVEPEEVEAPVVISKPEPRTNDESKKTTAITGSTKTGIVVAKPKEQSIAKTDQATIMKESQKTAVDSAAKTGLVIAKQEQIESSPKQEKSIKNNPVSTNQTTTSNNSPAKKESLTAVKNPETKTVAVTNAPGILTPPVKTTTESKKTDVTTVNVQTDASVVKTKPVTEKNEIRPDPLTDLNKLPSEVAGRKSEFSQFVTFKSDSLELALYDNGEIDGDTVSVFLNGKVLFSREGLKATAIKKTIYLTPGKDDEFTLVLFAENLGKYPPNTGLLVVHDGDDVYNVRFSADFQTNAGVLFKRKKK